MFIIRQARLPEWPADAWMRGCVFGRDHPNGLHIRACMFGQDHPNGLWMRGCVFGEDHSMGLRMRGCVFGRDRPSHACLGKLDHIKVEYFWRFTFKRSNV